MRGFGILFNTKQEASFDLDSNHLKQMTLALQALLQPGHLRERCSSCRISPNNIRTQSDVMQFVSTPLESSKHLVGQE